jgi:hypothetical protein
MQYNHPDMRNSTIYQQVSGTNKGRAGTETRNTQLANACSQVHNTLTSGSGTKYTCFYTYTPTAKPSWSSRRLTYATPNSPSSPTKQTQQALQPTTWSHIRPFHLHHQPVNQILCACLLLFFFSRTFLFSFYFLFIFFSTPFSFLIHSTLIRAMFIQSYPLINTS